MTGRGRVVLALTLVCGVVHAQGTTAVAAGAASATMSASPSPRIPLFGPEPASWRRADSGSSGALVRACGHVGQVRLSTDARVAWIAVVLANHGEHPSTIRPPTLRVRVNGGAPFEPEVQPAEEAALEPGWSVALRAVLPDKTLLAHADTLELTVPIQGAGGPCALTARLDRNPAAPRTAEEWMPYPVFELVMGAGPRLLLTDGQRRIGSHETTVELGLSAFASLHHGVTFDVLLEPHGEHGAAAALGRAPTVDPTAVSATTLRLGYTYRVLPTPWLSVAYGIGPGLYLANVFENGRSRDSATTLSAGHHLRGDLFTAPALDSARFGLGLTAYHQYLFAGHLGPASIRGHDVGLTLHLALGL